MARRYQSRKKGPQQRPLNMGALRGVGRTETGPGGDLYQVQYVGPSPRVYRCPGCLRDVGPGVDHVVAWPEEGRFGVDSGADARRHWHKECWRRKLRPS